MAPETFASLLDWDSEFFALRIGRLHEGPLTTEKLDAVNSWCCENHINCLYYLAEPSDTLSIHCAEEAGFYLVDLRVTLDLQLSPAPPGWQSNSPAIRMATADDIPLLRPIAAANHRDSRFYHDEKFSSERCDELYATWIEKSCSGYADAVLVADCGAGAIGYFTCHLHEGGIGQIGLVGVSSNTRGAGLGRQLLTESLSWFAANGVSRVDVVTQGRNVGAQRLYQSYGFRTKSMGLWFHKWFTC